MHTGKRTSQQPGKPPKRCPLAGNGAYLLFTLGLIGTGMLGVPVLAGSCAYAVAEGAAWNGSMADKPKSARKFYAVMAFAENNGEELGSLEMYCCASRNPSPREFQLIERAVCLAAIAIKRYRETGDGGDCRIHGIRSARGYVPQTPTSMN